MSTTDLLREMKPGETKKFPTYKRPSQLSAYFARLKEYGYRFRAFQAEGGGVMVIRLARVLHMSPETAGDAITGTRPTSAITDDIQGVDIGEFF